MERNQQVILKRGKHRTLCTVVHDHSLDTPPFPAVTVKKGSDEWIVGVKELMSPAAIRQELSAEFLATDRAKEVVAAFEAGNITVRAIANHLKKQMIDVLSTARKCERLGIIKLVKEVKPHNEIKTEQNQNGQSPLAGSRG